MDIVIFILALSILVLVHEFGHFFAAKITGVKVEEFGLGLPPRIRGWKWRGTEWSLNWLPIGGFCKLYGEDLSEKGASKNKNSFVTKNPWQKGLIVLGGVLMNLVTAVVVFSVVYSILGVPVETDKVKIVEIAANSPAAEAGLKVGDWVKSVAGVEVTKGQQLIEEVAKYKGGKAELEIEREKGQGIALSVQVRENPPAGEGNGEEQNGV